MIRFKNKILVIYFFPFLIFSCAPKTKVEEKLVDYKPAMIQADRDFSKLSEERGLKLAMLQFIDGRGVLLRPNSLPMVGGDAINFISQGNDSSYSMTWEPNGGNISKSGDMGYTYGVYSLKPTNIDTVFFGTYVSIWKRQPDGNWKFVLETGNEGIE